MSQDRRTAAIIVFIILALFAVVLVFGILEYARAGRGGGPGAFLFIAFHWASLFIPVYLLCCGFLLILRPFSRRRLLMLTLTVIPFLTGALILKTLFEEEATASLLTGVILTVFGRASGTIILLAGLVAELIIISKVGAAGRGHDPRRPRAEFGAAGRGSADGVAPRKPNNVGTRRERAFHPNIEQQVDPRPARTRASARSGGTDGTENRQLALVPEAAADTGQEATDVEGEAEVLDATFGELEEIGPEELTDDVGSHAAAEDPAGSGAAGQGHDPRRTKAELGATGGGATDGKAAAPPEQPDDDGGGPRSTSGPQQSFDDYSVPVGSILKEWSSGETTTLNQETREAGETLMATLAEFKIEAELTGIRKGPVITMFEILPSPGVKLSRVVNLADNIAMRLAASPVRIVAPIPGKHAVGIEVPNKTRSVVGFKEIISLELFKDSHYEIPVVLGKNISGEAQIVDLVHTPHLLIAGATGAGKSVCVNSIIGSILYQKDPSQVRLMLIDPKIVELKLYNDIPHLLTPVITDPKRAYRALNYCLYEMEQRYALLDSLGVRDIRAYNRKIEAERIATTALPYIVIVVDEFADLMATSGKEMEAVIARLAAMSRAVGIHLVLATQRPSVDVITGLIKANIPSRIAFMVASKFDSRIIIDIVGAEKLLGRGDMLFVSAWDPVPIRIQGAFMAEEEAEALADYVKTLGEPDYIDEALFLDDDEEDIPETAADDPLMDKAVEIVVTAGKASASYLQRRLKVGYNRAARLVEAMEAQGIVGPPNGSKPREILYVPDLRIRG